MMSSTPERMTRLGKPAENFGELRLDRGQADVLDARVACNVLAPLHYAIRLPLFRGNFRRLQCGR
jgi:hypothetical protein